MARDPGASRDRKQAATAWLETHFDEVERLAAWLTRYDRKAVEPGEVVNRAWEMIERRPDDADWLDDPGVEVRRRLKYAHLDLVRSSRRHHRREVRLDEAAFGPSPASRTGDDPIARVEAALAAQAVLAELHAALAAAHEEQPVLAAIEYLNLTITGREPPTRGWPRLAAPAGRIDDTAIRKRRQRLVARMRRQLLLAAERAGLTRDDLA